MIAAPAGGLFAALEQVSDPRGAQGRRFSLVAMLATTVCAILCGARGCSAISQWIRAQPKEVWWMLGFYRRPPSTNAFRNLLLILEPEVLERVLRDWIMPILADEDDQLEAVAIDGKTLCSTLGPHGRSIQLLALLDQRTGCVLSQMQVPTTTNEHKASLKLLRELVLEGRVITADAAYCQRDVCRQIVDSGGHYLIVVKDNQPELKEQIAAEFHAAFSPLHTASA